MKEYKIDDNNFLINYLDNTNTILYDPENINLDLEYFSNDQTFYNNEGKLCIPIEDKIIRKILSNFLETPIEKKDFNHILKSLYDLPKYLSSNIKLTDPDFELNANNFCYHFYNVIEELNSSLQDEFYKEIMKYILFKIYKNQLSEGKLFVKIVEKFNSNDQTLTQSRLKTNLTVPELAQLFNLLNELKPKIFDTKFDADIHRFISANFQTKKSNQDGISTEKLRQLFHTPEEKSVAFWEEHLQTMIYNNKKNK